MVYRILPFSLTLNDPYRRFQRDATMLTALKFDNCDLWLYYFTFNIIWTLFHHARSIFSVRSYSQYY